VSYKNKEDNKMKQILLMLFNYLLELATEDTLKKIADKVLDMAEDHFEQGSTKDNVVEAITAKIRSGFDVPDNDE
jgi:hypothetical protein